MNGRLLRHMILAILSWALFGYYWWLVAQRRVTPNTIRGIQILLLIVLLIWALTALWIHHNRRRFAGKPDRRIRRRITTPLPTKDHIGQAVVIAEPTNLAHARYVEIRVDPETRFKSFKICDPPPSEGSGS